MNQKSLGWIELARSNRNAKMDFEILIGLGRRVVSYQTDS